MTLTVTDANSILVDVVAVADVDAYLIFVIFFTQTTFLENKIYTEKRVNCQFFALLRQNTQ